MTVIQKIKIDKSIPVPLYYQLKDQLMNMIREGTLSRDELLPTEMDFTQQLGISRTTVRQAFTELAAEGWVYRVKSKGTFVSAPKMTQDFISRLLTYEDEMKQLGKVPSTKLLSMQIVTPPAHAAAALDMQDGQHALYLHRLRFADSDPIVTVETYLPLPACDFVQQHDLEQESLYKTLSAREETTVFSIHRKVEAVEANAADVEYLQMRKGKPVQLFHSIGYNRMRRPIEYSIARYRADRSSFEVTVFADQAYLERGEEKT